jgi:hypothetical protein
LAFKANHFPENVKITAYRNELSKIAKRMDEFDVIYSGHRKFIMDKKAVTDVLTACNDIIADPNCNEVYEKMMNGMYMKVHQVGLIGMTYSDNCL